jgi:hypothetical protein
MATTSDATTTNINTHEALLALREGKAVALRLFLVPIPLDSQAHWGTINPGCTYILRESEGSHFAYAFNRGRMAFGTWRYLPPEKACGISVWGHVFLVDESTGEVSDTNAAIFSAPCGRLELPKEFEAACVYSSLQN